jgi:hypothetical protein
MRRELTREKLRSTRLLLSLTFSVLKSARPDRAVSTPSYSTSCRKAMGLTVKRIMTWRGRRDVNGEKSELRWQGRTSRLASPDDILQTLSSAKASSMILRAGRGYEQGLEGKLVLMVWCSPFSAFRRPNVSSCAEGGSEATVPRVLRDVGHLS